LAQNYDAIPIPGGGVREGGRLPSWVQRRLDRAIQCRRDDGYIITLSAGTTHRAPPVDGRGYPIFESAAAAQYLVERGVAADCILVERYSYDTIGSAFFSRVVHADPMGLRRLLIITSDFHLARCEALFRWIYGLEPKAFSYELSFEPVCDSEMPAGVLAERLEKERKSLEDLLGVAERIRTMRDCHRWLFIEHRAYNALRSGFGGDGLSKGVLESY
jgi:hypothetical protein